MSRDPNQDPDNDVQRPGTSEAERQERITQPTPRGSKLSPEEAARLREEFPQIRAAHQKQVWNRLRRRRLKRHEAEELHQDVFLELHQYILENRYPDSIPRLLERIVDWKILAHVGAQKRAPATEALPSSSSEKPRSAPSDLDRAMDLRALAQHVLPKLSPEHQAVIKKVVLEGLSHSEAAEVLGLTEGRVKGRLAAAQRAMFSLAKALLPPSQRGPA